MDNDPKPTLLAIKDIPDSELVLNVELNVDTSNDASANKQKE